MRIVCDSCGTKYSISDDKVRGKVFKIRCKKCSHVIVVRGINEGAGAPAAVTGEGAVWYIVRGGQQDGPHTAEAVKNFLRGGEVTADTFSWREGFADWVKISDAEGLKSILTSAPAAARPAPAPAPRPAPAPAPTPAAEDPATRVVKDFQPDHQATTESASPLDDSRRASIPVKAKAPRAASAGPASGVGLATAGGLTVEPPRAAAPQADLPVNPSPEPKSNGQSGGPGMVQARNENSVLFSLSSLDAIKREEAAPANTEASGLIDIKALSASAAAVANTRSNAPASFGDDPFSASSAGPAIAVPAMMPMGTRRSNLPIFIAIGAVAFLILLIGAILIAVVVMRDEEPTQIVKTVGPDGNALAANTATGAAEDDDEGTKDETNDEDDDDDDGAAAADDDDTKDDADEAPAKKELTAEEKAARAKARKEAIAREKERMKDPKYRAEKARKEQAAKEKRAAAQRERAANKPVRRGGGGDSIDDILGQIDGKKRTKKTSTKAAAEPKAAPAAPAAETKLTKSQVMGVISRHNGKIFGCKSSQAGERLSGTIMVRFTIRPNGKVGGATVTSSKFKGKPVASCVTRVVRGMKFPASTKGTTINYPFRL